MSYTEMVLVHNSIAALQIIFMLTTTSASPVNDVFEEKSGELCTVCQCLEGVALVDCSMRGLTYVPGSGSSMVTKLNLSSNEISQFPENLSRFPNLLILDISGNQLNYLPSNALINLSFLEILNLSKNSFTNWQSLNPSEVFLPAKRLKVLELSHNNFGSWSNLGSNQFFISPSLEVLSLENCQIDSIHGKSPLGGLSNIKTLKLSQNPLMRIHNLVSPSLRSLDVSNCKLSYLYSNTLITLPSLIYLQMSHNYRLVLTSGSETLTSDSLKYLDISYCNVLRPSLGGFPNLKKAILSHNMINIIDNNEFENNTKLEYLDMSYNSISSLGIQKFRGLQSLQYLDMSWNELAKIPDGLLLETPSLTQINLSRNYLTSLGHFKSSSVTILDVSQCEIESLSKDSLEGLHSLIDINLSRNLLTNIPDGMHSNKLQYLNLNYNRISTISNFSFFMLPRLKSLSITGNRFTTIWNKDIFLSNPYLERIEIDDNMWRCDCNDPNMFDFYEYLTLEPSKKEESYSLICHSPSDVAGQTWLEACYFNWFPGQKSVTPDSVVWFLIIMIIGLSITFVIVSTVRRIMKRRLAVIQAERERQVEETRDRMRQLRMRAEQEAQCNAPDPRDLVAPPSYTEALSMPKLNASSHSLNETGSGKSRRKRGRRKTKSSSDLLDETERNGDAIVDAMELTENADGRRRQRRRRRSRKFGSHEIADLEASPGVRRRMSAYGTNVPDSVTVEVQAELEQPLFRRNRRNSIDDDEPRESDF